MHCNSIEQTSLYAKSSALFLVSSCGIGIEVNSLFFFINNEPSPCTSLVCSRFYLQDNALETPLFWPKTACCLSLKTNKSFPLLYHMFFQMQESGNAYCLAPQWRNKLNNLRWSYQDYLVLPIPLMVGTSSWMREAVGTRL